jgi:HEAT repeat protein
MGLLAARPPRVEKLKRRGDVAGLIDALAYEDDSPDRGAAVRVQAVAAVAQFDEPGVSEGLVQALADPSGDVRDAAIEALVARGPSRAVEPLCAAVTLWTAPEHGRARRDARMALEAMHDPAACGRVAKLMMDRPAELDDPDRETIVGLIRSAPGSDKRIVGELMPALGDPEKGARAATLLAWLAPQSTEPLLAALADETTREQAARALGFIHSTEAVEPLCRLLLEQADPTARRAAAWALGEIRDVSSVEALILATGDADYDVRTEASRAFDRFGNVGMAIALTTMMPQAALEAGAPAEDTLEASHADEEPSEPLRDEPTAEAAIVEDPAPSPGQATAESEIAGAASAAAGSYRGEPTPVTPVRPANALRRLLRRNVGT